jgi:3-phosphoinositide dependent protein kinase-1
MTDADDAVLARPTLAELSRNASVISSSSESEFAPDADDDEQAARPPRAPALRLGPAALERPTSPSALSAGPATPRSARPPPVHLRDDTGGASVGPSVPPSPQRSRAASRVRAGRSASANGGERSKGVSYADFEFGDVLGEGSYSTVRAPQRA